MTKEVELRDCLSEGLFRDVEVRGSRFDLTLHVNLTQRRPPRHVLRVLDSIELDLQRDDELDPVRELEHEGDAGSILLPVGFYALRGPGEGVLGTPARLLTW